MTKWLTWSQSNRASFPFAKDKAGGWKACKQAAMKAWQWLSREETQSVVMSVGSRHQSVIDCKHLKLHYEHLQHSSGNDRGIKLMSHRMMLWERVEEARWVLWGRSERLWTAVWFHGKKEDCRCNIYFEDVAREVQKRSEGGVLCFWERSYGIASGSLEQQKSRTCMRTGRQWWSVLQMWQQAEEKLERWRYAPERRGMKVRRSKTECMRMNERSPSGTVRLQEGGGF